MGAWGTGSFENDDAADEELISQAVAALDRVGENSELKDLWEDSSDLAEWQEAIENLRTRLLV